MLVQRAPLAHLVHRGLLVRRDQRVTRAQLARLEPRARLVLQGLLEQWVRWGHRGFKVLRVIRVRLGRSELRVRLVLLVPLEQWDHKDLQALLGRWGLKVRKG